MQHLQNWLAALPQFAPSSLAGFMVYALAFALLGAFLARFPSLLLGKEKSTPSNGTDRTRLERIQYKFGLHDWTAVWFLAIAAFYIMATTALIATFIDALYSLATLPRHPDFDANDLTRRNEHRVYAIQLTALATVMGVFVAFPLSLVRLRQASENQKREKDALYNDKINAALEDLHAMRQRTLEDNETTIWEADITRRNGAIDRLEALAHEKPDETPRIARTLCTYVKELSREYPPKEPPEGAADDDLYIWAQGLEPARSDMERAAQTLGRLHEVAGMTPAILDIDLSGANLQGFSLRKANFEKANLMEAQLQGANLNEANLKRADLIHAELQEADLVGAKLQRANLRFGDLRGAMLLRADLQEAILGAAEFRKAFLGEAKLQGAILMAANFQEAFLKGAEIQGADLRFAQIDKSKSFTEANTSFAATTSVDWRTANITQEQITHMFGDANVLLPEGITHPAHWPDTDLDLLEFTEEWEDWKSDPKSYHPPQDRNDD